MNSESYDSELSCKPSDELLQPIKVDYSRSEDNPPFKTHASTGGDHSVDGKSPPKPDQHNTGLGYSVLLSFLGPNHPDVARSAIENPLELEPFHNEPLSPERGSRITLGPAPIRVPDGPSKPPERPLLQIPSRHEKQPSLPSLPSIFGKPELPPLSSKLPYDPRSPEDSLATSPLGKYAISPSERPAQDQLPVIQSPPQSAGGASPENSQSLPSIYSALGDFSHPTPYTPFSPMTSSSPQCGRNNDQPLAILSTLRPPNTQDLPTSGSRPSNWSPSKLKQPDREFVGSPYDTSRKSPPVKSPGAAAYPTPMDYKSTGEPDQSALTPGNHSSPGSTAGGTYKCTHLGCTAAPFQTQYLLNSHANVHSQERPHFCPVAGCERGVGGKGFKRKNEMIRHGLVHNSPGYVCPFCPDQQHKYPRPDNLQRHVRVHHLDRGKDDPDLRKVLSQRPEGSNRGRRRRTHG